MKEVVKMGAGESMVSAFVQCTHWCAVADIGTVFKRGVRRRLSVGRDEGVT